MNITPVFAEDIIRSVALVLQNGQEATDADMIAENEDFWFCLPPSDDGEANLVVKDDIWYFVVFTGTGTGQNTTSDFHIWQFAT